MDESEGRGAPRASVVLRAMDAMDDAMLRAVIAHAQTRLLDRPVRAEAADDLAVEIVDSAERRLLWAFRTLDPMARGQFCYTIAQFTRAGIMPPQRSPGAVAATEDGAGPRRKTVACTPASAETTTRNALLK